MAKSDNLAGLSWYIDNHVVDSQEAETLRRFHTEGWIYLQTPDTVQVEQRRAFPMPLGPAVFGHSMFGHSVMGSKEDEERIAKVHKSLWPEREWATHVLQAPENAKARTCVRDTLIVSTSLNIAPRRSLQTMVESWQRPSVSEMNLEGSLSCQ